MQSFIDLKIFPVLITLSDVSFFTSENKVVYAPFLYIIRNIPS